MKLDILMHYEVNETTGEIKYIGKEEITVDSASTKASKSSTKKSGREPFLLLPTAPMR